MTDIRRRGLLVLLSAALTTLAPALVRADEPKKPDAKLNALLKERLATAKEQAALAQKAYQGGEHSLTAVHEATLAVLSAELDLCETNAERIAVHEKSVAEFRVLEALTAKLVETRVGTARDALKAKLARLEAEIALERLKSKTGNKGDGDKEIGKGDQASKKPHDHLGWWCDEHGVPEAECSMCSPKVAAALKAKGDWCDKHDRAKSQCFPCDPKLKEKYAAMYRAKHGKEPPPIEDEEEVKKAAKEQADKHKKDDPKKDDKK